MYISVEAYRYKRVSCFRFLPENGFNFNNKNLRFENHHNQQKP